MIKMKDLTDVLHLQQLDTIRSLHMTFKDDNEISKLSDELDSLYWQIVKMESEFKIIEYNGSIEEYNEAIEKINTL